MPEGDTLAWHANRIRPVLDGRAPTAVRTHARFGRDRWAERIQGHEVTGVESRGKHLLIHFDGDMVLHSHLGMVGTWGVYRGGRRWGRPARRAWLVMECDDAEIVQFDGSTLELLTEGRARQVLARLGPDILREDFEVDEVMRRLRLDDPTRPIGDTLLDQTILAGIGNLWKAEGCWEAKVDPWRPMRETSDAEIRSIIALVRPRMVHSGRHGMMKRGKQVYGRAGRPCPRCGTLIRQREQWEDNRLTYWCPGCQR